MTISVRVEPLAGVEVSATRIDLAVGGSVSITGGPGGATVHNDLTGRTADDAHPISAITGLQDALDAAGGGGDVVGPASATDGAVALFDGTTGKLLKNGSVLGTAATVDTGTGSGNAILGNDARLSDARTPTSHNHAASEITSGTIAQARLGTGSASSTTYLRGDQTWGTPTKAMTDFGSWTPSGKYLYAQGQYVNHTTGFGYGAPHAIWLPAGTIDGFGVAITSAGSAGAITCMWMYGVDNYLRTGDLVVDGGSVASDSPAAVRYGSFSATTITAGWYYLVAVSIGTGSSPQLKSIYVNTLTSTPPFAVFGSSPDFNNQPCGFRVTGLTATPASSWAAKNSPAPFDQTTISPIVIVRYQ